jgi:3-hydroxyisobutyrate dehydrogenase
MQKIALLGLGIMGSGMAVNWLQKGFDLTVYNRTRAKAEALAEQGAKVADTPKAAVQGAEIVVVMVGDDNASRSVWLGEDGALAGVAPGTVLIECSTLTPDWVRELAGQARERGCEFMDSPVAGSKAAAAGGQLLLLVGGDTSAVEKARPALEAISRQIVHLGPTGTGATWKLINNMLIAGQLALVSEALVLAEKAGFELEQVIPLILNGAGNSPIIQGKMPRLKERNYGDTDFALRWMIKDARYALALAEQLGLSLKTTEGAADLYQQAIDKGLADQDFAAVIEALRS